MSPLPDDQELSRKQAAEFLNTTTGTMAVWDSLKRHDLKPIKKQDGRVFYRLSVLEEFRTRDQRP